MTPRILTLLALLALSGTADARSLTDTFGRTVTVSPEGAYTVTDPRDGFSATVRQPNDERALYTINAMRPAYLPLPPLPAVTKLSRADFLLRFTPADDPGLLKRIIAAARSNDDIAQWLEIARSQDVIDLADPATRQGLDALVAAGLLSADRASQILTR